MTWKRRDILKGLLVAAAACARRDRSSAASSDASPEPALDSATASPPSAAPQSAARRRGIHLSPFRNTDGSEGLEIRDLDRGAARRVVLSGVSNGHSQILLPSNRAFVLPQFGASAVELDLAKGEVLRTFNSTPNNVFYGHGVLVQEGTVLLSVESGEDLSQAQLLLRDVSTLRMLEKFPAHGPSPHEIRRSADGKRVIIMNGNTPLQFERALAERSKKYPEGSGKMPPFPQSTINVVDLASGKLLQRIPLPPLSGAGHLAVTPEDAAIVGPGRKPEGVSARTPFGLGIARRDATVLELAKKSKRPLAAEEATFARTAGGFSNALDPARHRVCFTHPPEKGISVYDYASLELETVLRLQEQPMGAALAADGRSFVLTTNSGSLYELDAETLHIERLENEGGIAYFGHTTIVT